jgi:hypothetical protein
MLLTAGKHTERKQTLLSVWFSILYWLYVPEKKGQIGRKMHECAKKESDLVPGRSRDETGLDLETLKVPGPKSPGTQQVQKSRNLKIGKVPGKRKPYYLVTILTILIRRCKKERRRWNCIAVTTIYNTKPRTKESEEM